MELSRQLPTVQEQKVRIEGEIKTLSSVNAIAVSSYLRDLWMLNGTSRAGVASSTHPLPANHDTARTRKFTTHEFHRLDSPPASTSPAGDNDLLEVAERLTDEQLRLASLRIGSFPISSAWQATRAEPARCARRPRCRVAVSTRRLGLGPARIRLRAGPAFAGRSISRLRSDGKIEAIEIHDLGPRSHEVTHERLLRVVTCRRLPRWLGAGSSNRRRGRRAVPVHLSSPVP